MNDRDERPSDVLADAHEQDADVPGDERGRGLGNTEGGGASDDDGDGRTGTGTGPGRH